MLASLSTIPVYDYIISHPCLSIVPWINACLLSFFCRSDSNRSAYLTRVCTLTFALLTLSLCILNTKKNTLNTRTHMHMHIHTRGCQTQIQQSHKKINKIKAPTMLTNNQPTKVRGLHRAAHHAGRCVLTTTGFGMNACTTHITMRSSTTHTLSHTYLCFVRPHPLPSTLTINLILTRYPHLHPHPHPHPHP